MFEICEQNAESCSMNPIEGQRFDLSALHWATVYGHCRAMEALLKKGYDPNETISWVGLTAMQYAAAMDHGEAIDVLLKYGADPHLIIESGETPLHIISIYNKQASETGPPSSHRPLWLSHQCLESLFYGIHLAIPQPFIV